MPYFDLSSPYNRISYLTHFVTITGVFNSLETPVTKTLIAPNYNESITVGTAVYRFIIILAYENQTGFFTTILCHNYTFPSFVEIELFCEKAMIIGQSFLSSRLLTSTIEHALGATWRSATRNRIRLADGLTRASHLAEINSLALLQIIESSTILAQDRHDIHPPSASLIIVLLSLMPA